ncbi:hypothetical protein LCGC14_1496200 [marine sediment metagenome]|uniref:Uncharacterized protein n=1 Tax=marine sediment metagenome TaxID=412755 RepID=A0A0F9JRA6_9ZZZZ
MELVLLIGVPDIAVHNAAAKLESPMYLEGFDRLFSVQLVSTNGQYDYAVTPWEETTA